MNKICTFIKGDNIELIPNNPDNIGLYAKWINDPISRKYARNVLPLTLEEIKKRWFEPHENEGGKDTIVFEIWHKKDKNSIGIVGLNQIDWFSRWTNVFIQIGETKYWRQNIGTEVIQLLLNYAFNELDLKKISAGIADQNIGSWRVAEKSGFILEGISKKEFYVDGEYVDTRRYCYFKEDWMKLKKKVIYK